MKTGWSLKNWEILRHSLINTCWLFNKVCSSKSVTSSFFYKIENTIPFSFWKISSYLTTSTNIFLISKYAWYNFLHLRSIRIELLRSTSFFWMSCIYSSSKSIDKLFRLWIYKLEFNTCKVLFDFSKRAERISWSYWISSLSLFFCKRLQL